MISAAPVPVGLQRHITLENGCKVASGVTTLAIAALSWYASGWFTLGTIVLTAANVFLVSRQIQNGSSASEPLMRRWLAITSLATGAILLGITASWTLPAIGYGIAALKTLHLTQALFYAAYATGSLGFFIPASQVLFARGEELLKMGEWKELKILLDNASLKRVVGGFWETCFLIPTLLFPEKMIHLPFRSLQQIVLEITPAEVQMARLRELHKFYEASHDEEAWRLLIQGLNKLPEAAQYELFEEWLLQHSDKKSQLQGALCWNNYSKYTQKCVQEGTRIETETGHVITDLDALAADLKYPTPDVAALSAESARLSQTIVKLIGSAKLYSREHVTRLNKLQMCLLQGEIPDTIQKLNRAREKPLDREEYTVTILAANTTLYNDIKKLMNEFDNAALHAKLEEKGIEEIGKFVDRVLGGDESLLTKPDEITRRLELYMGERNRIYTHLSGTSQERSSRLAGVFREHVSQLDRLVARVVYRSALIFASLVPIIEQPVQTAVGMGLYTVTRLVETNTIPYITPLIRLASVALRVRFGYLFALATRRPFLSLVSPSRLPEMHTFESASLLGRARILFVEFGVGFLVASASYRELDLGGYIQGIALAREINEIGARLYRRYRAPTPSAASA